MRPPSARNVVAQVQALFETLDSDQRRSLLKFLADWFKLAEPPPPCQKCELAAGLEAERRVDRERKFQARHLDKPPNVLGHSPDIPGLQQGHLADTARTSGGQLRPKEGGRGRVPSKVRENGFDVEATEVLNFLNQKSGRAYRPVYANLKLIKARLREGASVRDCRRVIAAKAKEWQDRPEMVQYLRPSTLFGPEKFAGYIGGLTLNPDQIEREQGQE